MNEWQIWCVYIHLALALARKARWQVASQPGGNYVSVDASPQTGHPRRPRPPPPPCSPTASLVTRPWSEHLGWPWEQHTIAAVAATDIPHHAPSASLNIFHVRLSLDHLYHQFTPAAISTSVSAKFSVGQLELHKHNLKVKNDSVLWVLLQR